MTVVASADLIRYVLGSAVLIGCFALVWKLWALKPVEAPRAADGFADSIADGLLQDEYPQSADVESTVLSLLEPYGVEEQPQEELEEQPELDSALGSSELFVSVPSAAGLNDRDFFSTPPSHGTAPHEEIVTANASPASGDVTPEGDEDVLTTETEHLWNVNALEWGSALTEPAPTASDESGALPELDVEASTEELEAPVSDVVTEADVPAAGLVESDLPEGVVDEAAFESGDGAHFAVVLERSTASTEDAWSSAAAGTETTTTGLSRAQKRAARKAEKMALLEARRDEAKRRRDEARAKRSEKKSKRPADRNEGQGALLDAVELPHATEGSVAELNAVEAYVAGVSVPAEQEAVEFVPQPETAQRADYIEEAALSAMEADTGEVEDPFRAAALQAYAETPTTEHSDVAQEEAPALPRRKWRNKVSRTASSGPGEDAVVAVPAPFSIVPFSDTSWDDVVPEEASQVVPAPATTEPPQLDEWAVAALAETWAQPLRGDPDSTDPSSIDHHAYGLPEPLPQRRPAAFSA